MRRATPALLLAALATAPLTAQESRPSLVELSAIAKARAARQRPAQEQALAPYLGDLSLAFKDNEAFLLGRIQEVAKLGDGIAPVLLENMVPKDDSDAARNLAANCARVLEQMDPADYVDALLELAQARSETARSWALHLLGQSRSSHAALALANQLDGLKGRDLVAAIDALRQLGDRSAAPSVVQHVQVADRRLREAALRYLAQSRNPAVRATMLRQLPMETEPDMMLRYAAYLEGAVQADAEAADVLLLLIATERLDQDQKVQVVRALSVVAPKGHAGTMRALKGVVDRGDTTALGRQAALVLRDLGDRSGLQTLFTNLNKQVRERRRESGPYIARAEAYMALAAWEDATRDLRDAIEHSRQGSTLTYLYLQIAVCEAKRGRIPYVLKSLQDGRPSLAQIQEEAARHPEFQKALESDALRKYLEARSGERGR
ncbi:MAG: hypothetical protein IT458_04270 [Planctomycetes bacterium]|nr:hypothetical protein [Planctomycetota bacterium]